MDPSDKAIFRIPYFKKPNKKSPHVTALLSYTAFPRSPPPHWGICPIATLRANTSKRLSLATCQHRKGQHIKRLEVGFQHAGHILLAAILQRHVRRIAVKLQSDAPPDT